MPARGIIVVLDIVNLVDPSVYLAVINPIVVDLVVFIYPNLVAVVMYLVVVDEVAVINPVIADQAPSSILTW